ncbi:MAG TPA: type II toxin-antitoxin system RelE/ParE family toxin [Phycisphaerae bacterium]|nr:type II toxin-antitoxin system RelE/ParE family toxin [Phycisphaerae bacterium]
MARIVRRAAARQDLIESYAFIGMDNLDAAERFLAAAHNTVKRLLEAPEIGRLRLFSDSRLRGIRSWPVRGFESWLIFYRPLPDGIEILRVLHGARDVEATLEEAESRQGDELEENT